MVGTALYKEITGFQQDFFVVEHDGDLAFQYQGIVNRLGAVHKGVFCTALFVGRCGVGFQSTPSYFGVLGIYFF